VRCEPPNSRLYHFTGNLELPQPGSAAPTVVPVPPAAVLLRGCSLRNTHKIFGLVLYAGGALCDARFWRALCGLVGRHCVSGFNAA
jgi:hypothetical protein